MLGEVIRFYMTPWIQAEHPEWQELNSPGAKPISVAQLKDMHVLGCWNSPYGEWFIKSQVALVKRLDWDGYNMDGFGCWAQCFCPSCSGSFKADTGKEIPATGDVNNSDFRHYLKWRLDRYTKFVYRWTAALKAVKPGLRGGTLDDGPRPMVALDGRTGGRGNRRGAPRAGRSVPRAVLGFPPDQGSNLLPAFTCRYYRGLTGDRPAWILPYLCEQGQFNMQPPRAECDLREMTVLTNGCLVAQGHWQQNDETPLAHLNKQIAQREPFTREARSLKWAAMLVGESSRLLYGLSGAAPRCRWVRGSAAAWIRRTGASSYPASGGCPRTWSRPSVCSERSMEDHLPLDIIIEPDVENAETLKQYKVLILPNAACLSAQGDRDDSWVRPRRRWAGGDARKLAVQRVRRPPG